MISEKIEFFPCKEVVIGDLQNVLKETTNTWSQISIMCSIVLHIGVDSFTIESLCFSRADNNKTRLKGEDSYFT